MINYYDKERVDKALALLNETSELLTDLASFNDAQNNQIKTCIYSRIAYN